MVVHICYIEYTYKMAMSDPWENPNYKEALGYLKSYPPLALTYFRQAGVSKDNVLKALGNAKQLCLDFADDLIGLDDNLFTVFHGLAEKIMDIEDELEGCKA